MSMGTEDEELFSGASIALYDFEPENANELPLREGQEIMVSYRHGQGWLVAEDPVTGEQGLVPEEYVRLVRDLDMDMWYQQDEDSFADGEGEVDGEMLHGEARDEDMVYEKPRGGSIDLSGEGLEMKPLPKERAASDIVTKEQDTAHGNIAEKK